MLRDVAKDIKAALEIDGWLSESEAFLLHDTARHSPGPIIEIGSWQGRSTAAIALGSMRGRNQRVYAVDDFSGVKENGATTHLQDVSPGPNSSTPELLRSNLSKAGVNGIVTVVPLDSHAAAADLPNDCGMVFVDGNHEGGGCLRDLNDYMPKIRVGGMLVVHDADGKTPEVTKDLMTAVASNDEWRMIMRRDSTVAYQRIKPHTVRHKVILACPGASFDWGVVESVASCSRRHDVTILNNGNGFDDFNFLWAGALNKYATGEATHFAMLHSDLAVLFPQWLDLMIDELENNCVELISTAIGIKDARGLTSCGVGEFNESTHWGAFRRFTVREILDMPPTFTIKDTPHPDKYLLHNTGCWVCDLSSPIFHATEPGGDLRCWFDFPTKIIKDPSGMWRNVRESEDWFFSRKIAELDARTAITRKVPIDHIGRARFGNHTPWGTYEFDRDSQHRWNAKNG